MKQPKPKLHLLDVSEPLLAYHNLIVRCGKTLRNAEPLYMVDRELLADISRPNWMICKECRLIMPDSGESSRYEYGLREAEEGLHATT